MRLNFLAVVELQMVDYMARQAVEQGTPWPSIARYMLGLRHGLPGSRRWRRVWSDHKLKTLHPRDVMALAHAPAQQGKGSPPVERAAVAHA